MSDGGLLEDVVAHKNKFLSERLSRTPGLPTTSGTWTRTPRAQDAWRASRLRAGTPPHAPRTRAREMRGRLAVLGIRTGQRAGERPAPQGLHHRTPPRHLALVDLQHGARQGCRGGVAFDDTCDFSKKLERVDTNWPVIPRPPTPGPPRAVASESSRWAISGSLAQTRGSSSPRRSRDCLLERPRGPRFNLPPLRRTWHRLRVGARLSEAAGRSTSEVSRTMTPSHSWQDRGGGNAET